MPLPDEDETVGGTRRVPRQNHPFDQRVGIALQDALVVESAGVAFLAVAEHVFRRGGARRQEAPLHPRGKRGAPSSSQARRLDLLQHLPGLHGFQRPVQRRVSVVGHVLKDVVGVYIARVAKYHPFLEAHALRLVQARHIGRRPVFAGPVAAPGVRPFGDRLASGNVPLDDLPSAFRGDVRIEHPRSTGECHVHDRLGVAESQGAYLACRGVNARFLNGLQHSVVYRVRTRRLAGRAVSHAHPRSVAVNQARPARQGLRPQLFERYRHDASSCRPAVRASRPRGSRPPVTRHPP